MKILKKIFLWFLILAVFFFAGLAVLLKAKGKEILTRELSRALGTPVRLGEAHLVLARPSDARFLFFPGLRFENVEIPSLVKVRSVNVYLSASFLSGGRLNILKIILEEPIFVLERKKGFGETVKNNPAETKSEGPAGMPVPKPAQRIKKGGVFIEEFEVLGGELRVIESGSEQEFPKWNLEQISLRARGLAFPPMAGNTKFSLKAKIGGEGGLFPKGNVEAQGTADLFGKNMDAAVKIKGADERVGLSADVKSVNNDVTVTGKIDAGWLLSGLGAKDSANAALGNLVAGALKIAFVNVPVDFSFKTKMDDFRVDAVAFSGVVDYEGKKDNGPGENAQEDLKSIGKEFEALGKKFYEENIKTPVNAVP